MTVALRSLEVALPGVALAQDDVRDVFAAQPGLGRLGTRLVPAAFNASGIDRRHTVLGEWGRAEPAGEPVFFDARTLRILNPSTGTRNGVYAQEATGLFVRAAARALAACEGVEAADITHVITVSCTGFYAPGPDYHVVRGLGLDPAVQRYHLGFMGCYAAFPALRQAKSICEATPEATVLVVCAELCTLHVRTSDDPDTIVASSLFGDGAAAAVVTGRELDSTRAVLQLDHFETVLTPTGEEAMAWNIGDNGFEMVLGAYVPHIIDGHIVEALAPLLAHDPGLLARPYSEIEHWAIHPGGRSILDKVEGKLALRPEQLVPSRETLRDYGNMSSATVLFVLKHILDGPSAASGERICGMAFGPGLTVESALMTKLGATGAPVPAVGDRAAVGDVPEALDTGSRAGR
ncbi:type III polyketide synthase [Kocuria sp. CPCC 205300]|uniref:type III polyketide synthase n=1 Tax=Kocuria sabuli TaxID=3071448 RepID=UPI0036DE945A